MVVTRLSHNCISIASSVSKSNCIVSRISISSVQCKYCFVSDLSSVSLSTINGTNDYIV